MVARRRQELGRPAGWIAAGRIALPVERRHAPILPPGALSPPAVRRRSPPDSPDRRGRAPSHSTQSGDFRKSAHASLRSGDGSRGVHAARPAAGNPVSATPREDRGPLSVPAPTEPGSPFPRGHRGLAQVRGVGDHRMGRCQRGSRSTPDASDARPSFLIPSPPRPQLGPHLHRAERTVQSWRIRRRGNGLETFDRQSHGSAAPSGARLIHGETRVLKPSIAA